MENKGCVLWEKARVLGQDRGLEMSVTCPVSGYCEGTHCIYLSEEVDNMPYIDENIDQMLERLRNELKEMK